MYRISIKKPAKKFIDKLPKNEKLRVIKAIERLPEGEDIKKLKGHDNIYRLRVGDYRILYTVDNGGSLLLSLTLVTGGRYIINIKHA